MVKHTAALLETSIQISRYKSPTITKTSLYYQKNIHDTVQVTYKDDGKKMLHKFVNQSAKTDILYSKQSIERTYFNTF